MYLIKEIEFIELNDTEVIMINLINGATDVLEKALYSKIIKNDFDSIDDEVIDAMKARKYLFSAEAEYKDFIASIEAVVKDYELKAPPSFLVVPSYACNLNCIYCYEQTYMIKGTTDINPVVMVDKQFERIDKIVAAHEEKYGKIEADTRITIMGGEPLLVPNYAAVEHIFKSAKARSFTVDIVSNGVELDKYLDLFNQYNIDTLKHIQITVDGVKEIHDGRRIFRDKRGSFDIIMANIKLAIKNNIKIILRVNVDATNINELPDLADALIQRFGQNELLQPYLYLLQDGGCSGEANIVSEKIGIEKLFEMEAKNPNMKIFRKKFHAEAFINSIFDNIPYQPKLKHCGAMKNQFILDCKSNVYKCWHGIGNNDYSIGKFYPEYKINQKKANAWLNRSVNNIEKCQTCKYRYICGTGCPAAKHMSEAQMDVSEPSCNPFDEIIKAIILEKMKNR